MSSGVLSASICDCQSTSHLKDFQINVVNKAMIHYCSSYCLRRQSAKKGNDSDKSVEPFKVEETVVRKCRMNFGIYDEKTKTSSSKPIRTVLILDMRVVVTTHILFNMLQCDHFHGWPTATLNQ